MILEVFQPELLQLDARLHLLFPVGVVVAQTCLAGVTIVTMCNKPIEPFNIHF